MFVYEAFGLTGAGFVLHKKHSYRILCFIKHLFMNTKILQKAVVALGVAAAVTPLLVLPMSFIFPFIVPKILFFRSVVILSAVCYAGLLFSSFQSFRPRLQALHIAVLFFFFSLTG